MMGAVPPNRRGIAAGTRTMLQNTGAVISIAFVLAIVTAGVPKDVLFRIFSGLATGLSDAQLDAVHREHARGAVGARGDLARSARSSALLRPCAPAGARRVIAERTLRIGEVAELVGTTPRTIRYYEEIGLLPTPPGFEKGRHRTLGEAEVARLKELIRLRDLLGISLEELKGLVEAEEARAVIRERFQTHGRSGRAEAAPRPGARPRGGAARARALAARGARPARGRADDAPEADPVAAEGDRGLVIVRWYGQSAFLLSGSRRVFIDPFGPMDGLAARGLTFDYPPIEGVEADLVLVTHEHGDHNVVEAVGGSPARDPDDRHARASRRSARSSAIASEHDDVAGTKRGANTIFRFSLDGLSFAHLGDFGQPALRPEQREALGSVDVLFMPVGGGPTIGGEPAAALVRELAPRLVIPMHYATPAVNFLEPPDAFLDASAPTSSGSTRPRPSSSRCSGPRSSRASRCSRRLSPERARDRRHERRRAGGARAPRRARARAWARAAARRGRGGRRQLPRRLRARGRQRAPRAAVRRRRRGRRARVVGHAASAVVAWATAPGSYAERVRRARRAGGAGAGRRRRASSPRAALLQGMTAHYLATDTYAVQPGDDVLVHAAAGGVGLLLTQIVKLARRPRDRDDVERGEGRAGARAPARTR